MPAKNSIPHNCEQCSKAFTVQPARLRAGRGHYCSRECADAARRETRGPRWKGIPWPTASGYLVFTPEGTHKATYVHRYVMEQHLGRKLRGGEHIHHINGDKTDNRLENLQVMTHSEHALHHLKNGHPERWARDYDACVRCGTTETRHNAKGLCQRCYQRAH